MKSPADHLELRQVLEGLPGIISIIDRYRSLNNAIDNCTNFLKHSPCSAMSSYFLSDSKNNLARFGDRVEIIVGLAVGGKLDEREAFNEIKLMYKDLKKNYKSSKPETNLIN